MKYYTGKRVLSKRLPIENAKFKPVYILHTVRVQCIHVYIGSGFIGVCTI